jgi:hypothetical protein
MFLSLLLGTLYQGNSWITGYNKEQFNATSKWNIICSPHTEAAVDFLLAILPTVTKIDADSTACDNLFPKFKTFCSQYSSLGSGTYADLKHQPT